MLYKSDKQSGSNGQTGELAAVYWGRLKATDNKSPELTLILKPLSTTKIFT
jgi:hypothetical protein